MILLAAFGLLDTLSDPKGLIRNGKKDLVSNHHQAWSSNNGESHGKENGKEMETGIIGFIGGTMW